MTNRRTFIHHSLGASAAMLLPSAVVARAARATSGARLLILGGTDFLGPAVVEAAVTAGHTVTLFNRGKTRPELCPGIEKLRGVRSANAAEEDLSALRGRSWDAVIDVWPSDPAIAESAGRALAAQTRHYLYVSSIATYDPRGFARVGLTEDAALNVFDPSIRSYNRGKSESERRLMAIYGDRLAVARPGAIKGTGDSTPDLLAWLRRAQAGGTHIGPGSGGDHVQIVDVKDVARFLVLAVERQLSGAYNVVGPATPFREFTRQCNAVMRSSATYTWIPQDFLHAQGLDPAPWDSPTKPSYLGFFPFWHPEPDRRGFYQVSNARAMAAGWHLRPFEETALDYLWTIDSAQPPVAWTDELAPEVEARVLAEWARR